MVTFSNSAVRTTVGIWCTVWFLFAQMAKITPATIRISSRSTAATRSRLALRRFLRSLLWADGARFGCGRGAGLRV